MTLQEALEQYEKSGIYPFHMPGHKRRSTLALDAHAYDITEIDGFDNLYEANGLLAQIKDLGRKVYHSRACFLLVNGSTVGNLVSIFAATGEGDTIIIGRNAHKSVYHGALLRGLHVAYTTPVVSEIGMVLGTPLAEYRRAIESHPDAKAIVVTSPTYEGMNEDVAGIAELAHAHHMVLIVDAAHGAHYGSGEAFGKNPVDVGADLVVMSLHKTLPALTQTALLHIGKDSAIDEERVAQYLEMFQTSSPSYLLMSSIEQALLYQKEHPDAFLRFAARMEEFYRQCSAFSHLSVVHRRHQDLSKVVVDGSKTSFGGHALMEMLRDDYGLELEMASFSYCLAMTGVMDTEEGISRLYEALNEIDQKAQPSAHKSEISYDRLYAPSETAMEQKDAMACEKEAIPLVASAGRVAAKHVLLYPPGSPVFVMGEVIAEEKIALLQQAIAAGLTVTGIQDGEVFVVAK